MIRSKEWPPGHLLPTETELAAQFDCAQSDGTIVHWGNWPKNRLLTEGARRAAVSRDGRERMANLKIQFPCREIEAMGKEHRYVSTSKGNVRTACALAKYWMSTGLVRSVLADRGWFTGCQ